MKVMINFGYASIDWQYFYQIDNNGQEYSF